MREESDLHVAAIVMHEPTLDRGEEVADASLPEPPVIIASSALDPYLAGKCLTRI